MMDETNEANIQKFITRINEQIQSFAVGLPSNDSRLLARALLAQGCNLLDRSTTPLLNLTS